MVASMRVAPAARLTLENLRITGLAAWRMLDPHVVVGLPGLSGSAVWPSVVSDVNSTVSLVVGVPLLVPT